MRRRDFEREPSRVGRSGYATNEAGQASCSTCNRALPPTRKAPAARPASSSRFLDSGGIVSGCSDWPLRQCSGRRCTQPAATVRQARTARSEAARRWLSARARRAVLLPATQQASGSHPRAQLRPGVAPDRHQFHAPAVHFATQHPPTPHPATPYPATPHPVTGPPYSHSMVAGGFELTSYVTRFTPFTSLMTRFEIRASTSVGNGYQSAVMPSRLVTARSATTWS